MGILDKGKQLHQEDVIVEVGEPSGSSPNEDPSSLPNVEDHTSEDVTKPHSRNLMYKAVLTGDWKTASTLISRKECNVVEQITGNSEIALHIAVAAKHKDFVRNLLREMDPPDLSLKNKDGNTPLSFAAALGDIETAEMLINMNRDLPDISNEKTMTPIHIAALYGHGEMVQYLFSKTSIKDLNDQQYLNLFHTMISADIYGVFADVPMWMLERVDLYRKELALYPNSNKALHLLARKTSAISHKSQLNLFQQVASSFSKGSFYLEAKMRTLAHRLVEKLWYLILPTENFIEFIKSFSGLLFDAAELGNVEFLVILIRSHLDLLWIVDNNNRTLFHVAALYRHENIFSLIYELGGIKDLIASYKEKQSKDTLLHLVARLPPMNRQQVGSGAALHMQKELLWFKAVKEIVPRSYIETKNTKGELAHDIFTEQHENLRKEGERWMKETATACMLGATLIATVVFAAAITIPGGNDDSGDKANTLGFPNFRKRLLFDIFTLSDSVALFSSMMSIVIFLSIFTSRYAEEDFRYDLPTKLMFGLSALFISIISMILAFTFSMILIRVEKASLSLVLISCLASLTALTFAYLYFHLWFNTLRSVYISMFLFLGRKRGIRIFV
ncbi:putative ankyrin repeat-containing domain, PGG domain, ankyrin repeat-containing domain superfamily [Arabidopsis thaliana]